MKRTKLNLKRSTIHQLSPVSQSRVAGAGLFTANRACSGSCTNPGATTCLWDGTARCSDVTCADC
jgi:hypothetical protein